MTVMRWLLTGWIVMFNLLLPSALLIWLFKTKAISRVLSFSIVLLLVVLLFVMQRSIFGFWHVVGTYLPPTFLVALVAILMYRLRRGLPTRWFPRVCSREAGLTAMNVLHVVAWSLTIPFLLHARAYTGDPLKLSSPLRGGTYYVISGGANNIVNLHSPDPSGKYAMDLTRLNAFGMRATGLFPDKLADYAVFESDIIAPCAGEVISVESSLPNRRPLDPDSSNRTGGNHVVLYCNGHSVLLAHMNTGTVTVAVGDLVTDGQLLGRVGSSGNAFEPHLHIGAVEGRHANVREAAAQSPNGVKSSPLLIDGRFLSKGDSFVH